MTTQRTSVARRPLVLAIAAGAAGAALALGALWASGEITSPATAQQPPAAGKGNITLSVAQLRINQRISQAAVRRSNESLNLLDPLRGIGPKGWRTDDLRDGIITGPKVANDAITGPKVADGTVTAPKITDGAVTVPKVANGAITGPKVADDAITGPKITGNALTTSKVADGAMTGPKLAAGSVDRDKLTADLANQLPMWAVLNPGAAIMRGRGAVSAERIATGNYRVVFERDVSRCSFTATHNLSFGLVYAYGVSGDPNAVRVTTSTYTNPGVPSNAWVTVQVLC